MPASATRRLSVTVLVAAVSVLVLQTPARHAETSAATWLVGRLGVGHVGHPTGSSVLIAPHGRLPFEAIVTPSCSSFASVLAIAFLAACIPARRGHRKLAASAAAMAAVVAGNVVRIAAALVVGVFAGRSSLVLFHDSVGNLFSFAYTLGGFIVLLWLLLPAGEPAPATGAHGPA